MMINLPSVRWRGQDTICEVYDDKIVVKSREADESVRNLIVTDSDATTVGTAWDFRELGEDYTYEFDVGGEPIETHHIATFKANGRVVDTVEFESGASVLPRVPDVPEKTGFTGVWEPYTLTDADITINAIYTANTYHVTFKADEAVVAVVPYQYGTQSITEPPVPTKEGYIGSWSAYTLGAQDSVSTAIYTPIQPTIHLYNYDGNVISDVYNFNYQQIYSAYNWEGDEING